MKKLDHKDFVAKFGPKFSQGGNAVLLNVQDEEMFHNEHIPGSLNAPFNAFDFLDRVHEVAADRKASIVVYSASEDCPMWEMAARQLEDDGYSDIFVYTGGIEGWKEEGNEAETSIPDMTPKEEAARGGAFGA